MLVIVAVTNGFRIITVASGTEATIITGSIVKATITNVTI